MKPDTRIYFHDADGKVLPGSKPAKQSYKDQCDINRILDKAARTGTVSHLNKHAQFYADVADFDYEVAQNEIAKANSAFYDLPAEVRREFGNKPGAFLSFLQTHTDEEIREKLPELAAPGRQLPQPNAAIAASAERASTGGGAADSASEGSSDASSTVT